MKIIEDKNKDDEDEIETIFKFMKSREEDSNLVVYFLLMNYNYNYNEEMYKFIFNHLDDDMINNDLSSIIFVIRKFIIENGQGNSNQTKLKRNKYKTIDNKQYKLKTIEFNGNELSGIFSYLNSKQQENSNINQFQVKGGGEMDPQYPITNLFKYDSDHIIGAYINNKRNGVYPKSTDSWIEFDFGERKINLSSYSIRTNSGSAYINAHPKTWIISGSNDRQSWELINRQVNNSSLNSNSRQHRFECDKQDKYYRYIRYNQDDVWHQNR